MRRPQLPCAELVLQAVSDRPVMAVSLWLQFHKAKLESVFYSAAIGADNVVHVKHYLSWDIVWTTFDERTLDFTSGIVLHHLPDHTASLCGIQANLSQSGSHIFILDHAYIWVNYEGMLQGHLSRDYLAWFNSNQRSQRLAKTTCACAIFGYDLGCVQNILGKVTLSPSRASFCRLSPKSIILYD